MKVERILRVFRERILEFTKQTKHLKVEIDARINIMFVELIYAVLTLLFKKPKAFLPTQQPTPPSKRLRTGAGIPQTYHYTHPVFKCAAPRRYTATRAKHNAQREHLEIIFMLNNIKNNFNALVDVENKNRQILRFHGVTNETCELFRRVASGRFC